MRLEFRRILPICLAMLLLGAPWRLQGQADPDPRGVSLTVTNPHSHARMKEPLTSGAPLPRQWKLSDASHLVLLDSEGEAVPLQVCPLARWGDLEDPSAPLRWVLLDFQADVAPRDKAQYLLKVREKEKESTKPIPGVRVEEGKKGIVVDTGALRFTVSKERFDILGGVSLNGDDEAPPFSKEGTDGLLLWKDNRPWSAAWGPPEEVVVEEQGPLRVVLRVHGRFYNRQGEALTGGDARPKPDGEEGPDAEALPLEYTVRLHAYAGKPHLRIVCTLENNGNGLLPHYPMNDTSLQGFELEIPLPEGETNVLAEGKRGVLESGDRLDLVQTHDVQDKADEEKNFSFSLDHNGRAILQGKRARGWIAAGNDRLGVTVAVSRFWERFPKSLSLEEGRLKIGLLPRDAAEHYFSGGWHMSDEIWIRFHPWKEKKGAAARFALESQRPLFAQVPPAWFADTGAWWLVAPRYPGRGTQKKALERYEKYQEMLVEPSASKEGLTLESLREARHLGRTHYGWSDFGDIAWKGEGGPFCALHYDWPYILWLQFLRSGDLRYLPLARQLTDHSADMDQIHGAAERGGGIWWWEELDDGQGRHKSLNTSGLILSHTWSEGYALGYLLTGERRYLESVQRGAQAARRHWAEAISGKKVVEGQARSQGWSILLLVNLYRITGEEELLTAARRIFENSLLYTESLPTPPGTSGLGVLSYNQAYQKERFSGKAVITFITYHLEPLCALHYEMDRAGMSTISLERFLVRSLDWLKEYAYVGGKRRGDGRISLLTLSYATDLQERSRNQGGELAHNIHVAGAFGYGYLLLRDENSEKAQSYLQFARHLFRDLMLYRTVAEKDKNQFHDPLQLSPVSWGWLPTATKEIGWIGRGGQPYLYAEYFLEKISPTPHRPSKPSQ